MSNKPRERLIPLDRLLRDKYPIRGFTSGGLNCQITIEFRQGFELFNTREYHNYETWSDGYYVQYEDAEKTIYARGEDLDEALGDLHNKLQNGDKWAIRIKETLDTDTKWAINNKD
jgi:hypothetical protein